VVVDEAFGLPDGRAAGVVEHQVEATLQPGNVGSGVVDHLVRADRPGLVDIAGAALLRDRR